MSGQTRGFRAVGARRRGVLPAVLLSVAALTALTACSSSSGGGSSDDSVTAPAPDPPTTAIANVPADRTAVTQTGCRPTSSGWEASGTVTNSRESTATYTIVISFTTKTSTVLARGTTKVTVASAATKKWTAAANFAKTTGVQCVLRGVSAGE